MSTRYLQLFLNLYPNLRSVVFDWKKALIRAHTIKLQTKFLRRCKEECVIPKSLTTNSLRKIRNDEFGLLENILLNTHFNNARKESKIAFKETSELKRTFESQVPLVWSQLLKDHIYNALRRELNSVTFRHTNRLNSLMDSSPWNSYGKLENFVNLSNKQLTKDQVSALSLGMKFNNSTNKPDIVKVEKAMQMKLSLSNEEETKNLLIAKGIIYSAYINSNNDCFFPKRFNIALKSLKRDKNIHITRADKSKTIVIMDKIDYNNKMQSMLEDRNIYEHLISNPLERYNATYNRQIREIFVHNKAYIDRFKCKAKTLPYLYGTSKTHKPGNNMRPIISTVGSATYFLSRFLVNLLKPLIGTISSAHVENSVDFVEKLKNANFNPNEYQMISFDVTSLFTNVPVDDVLDYLNLELAKYPLSLPVPVILKSIRLCVVDTYFSFNDKYYKQIFGMQMGNCLSPMLANIYMEFFESRIANNVIPVDSFWCRYVDDTFCLINIHTHAQDIANALNNLRPTIKFTLESEQNNSLSFLDTVVMKGADSFKFKIHRKSTNNNLIIHAMSHHHYPTKLTALRSFFLRALKICCNEYLKDELDNIRAIGNACNFSQHDLDLSLKLATETLNHSKPKFQFNGRKNLTIPYHPTLKHVIHPLKILGYDIHFSYPNTIGKSLIRNSPTNIEGCVYKIPCRCGQFYIGQTFKPLIKRVHEHQKYIHNDFQQSAVNLHTKTCPFPIDFKNSHALFKSNLEKHREIIESACIKKSEGRNINLLVGPYPVNPLLVHILNMQYNIDEKL